MGKVSALLKKKFEIQFWQILIVSMGIFAVSKILAIVFICITIIIGCITYFNKNNKIAIYCALPSVLTVYDFLDVYQKNGEKVNEYQNEIKLSEGGWVLFFRNHFESNDDFIEKCKKLRKKLVYIKAQKLKMKASDCNMTVTYQLHGDLGAAFQL